MAVGTPRDHGGGLDAAIARFGGDRSDWVDLSTGINPWPYPVEDIPAGTWQVLPDTGAMQRLLQAARSFWRVPGGADICAAPGVSALIARLPALATGGTVTIGKPTYNEHEAAFLGSGYRLSNDGAVQVFVHPNNPDGRQFSADDVLARHRELTVIDESFCDCMPEASLIALCERPGIIVLKGTGKFWGLAGMRLGFAMARADSIGRLSDLLGPWPVAGPALWIGAKALTDEGWATETRRRLSQAAQRLDRVAQSGGLSLVGGTDLFRLYSCFNSDTVFRKLAAAKVLSRRFPYSDKWIRLGLPGAEPQWQRLSQAMGV